MRCLVTGATGFIGSFLVQHLCEAGHDVTALVRVPDKAKGLLPPSVHLHPGEVEDQAACTQAVEASQPERVFHLAAQSYPQISWQEPQATFRTNVLGTLHMLEAVRSCGIKPVMVAAGSSAEYAVPADGAALSETARLHPSSPYGVSKLAADFAAGLYAERHGLHVVRVRPFFLIGPRKIGDVCSDFARGIVQIERGAQTKLRIGNLEIVRDFLDVADGVRALMHVAEHGKPGEVYNICSGRGYRLRDVLDQFAALAKVQVAEEVDPSLLRPVDEPVKVGDPARLLSLGWKPTRTLGDSLRDILEYWRSAA